MMDEIRPHLAVKLGMPPKAELDYWRSAGIVAFGIVAGVYLLAHPKMLLSSVRRKVT